MLTINAQTTHIMNIKVLLVLLSCLIVVIMLPAMAISQGKTKTLCQELNDLRAQSVSALVDAFRGEDSLEAATLLLRETASNPIAAQRFDAAADALSRSSEHQSLLANIAHLEANPRARQCPGIAQSRFIAPLDTDEP